jgi:hypothetical protein
MRCPKDNSRAWNALSAAALVAAVALIVGPPRYFVGHPHWSRIVWRPFSERGVPAGDYVQNLVVFFPSCFLFGRGGRKSSAALFGAGVLAMLIAAACEFYQVFCHERFPSATDLCLNTVGAIAGLCTGAALAKLRDRGARRDAGEGAATALRRG